MLACYTRSRSGLNNFFGSRISKSFCFFHMPFMLRQFVQCQSVRIRMDSPENPCIILLGSWRGCGVWGMIRDPWFKLGGGWGRFMDPILIRGLSTPLATPSANTLSMNVATTMTAHTKASDVFLPDSDGKRKSVPMSPSNRPLKQI